MCLVNLVQGSLEGKLFNFLKGTLCNICVYWLLAPRVPSLVTDVSNSESVLLKITAVDLT